MKYSIHRCLAELKTLDSRIRKATDKNFIGYKKLSAKKEAKTNYLYQFLFYQQVQEESIY